jgi:hypothetical protein
LEEELPTTVFNGRLKQIRFGDLSDAGKQLMDFAFPGFLGAVPDASAGASGGIKNRRRFAPGSDFPRGRYYSVVADYPVSENERIDDGGTMVGELRAYCDPLTAGEVLVFDTASNTGYSRSARRVLNGNTLINVTMSSCAEDIVIYLYDLPRIEQRFGKLSDLRKATGLRLCHDDDHLSLNLGYDISDRMFKRTIDLRYPKTRIAVCKKCLEIMTRWQPSAIDEHRFNWLDGLAILLDPHIGGNFVTTLIGKLAVIQGAEAIIFPSARNDFVATYKEGVVEYFQGWNLIDVSNYTLEQTDFSDADPLTPDEGGPPTRFNSGFMPQTFDSVRVVTYDEPFGRMKPILLLTAIDGPYSGSLVTAGLARRVERGFWEAWLSGRSRWGAPPTTGITERQREDARYALRVTDEVVFPAIYKSRRVMSQAILQWHQQIRERISGLVGDEYMGST